MNKYMLSIFLLVGIAGSDILVSPIRAMNNSLEERASADREAVRGQWVADGVMCIASKLPMMHGVAKWYNFHTCGQQFNPEYRVVNRLVSFSGVGDQQLPAGAFLDGEIPVGADRDPKQLGLQLLIKWEGNRIINVSVDPLSNPDYIYAVAKDGSIYAVMRLDSSQVLIPSIMFVKNEDGMPIKFMHGSMLCTTKDGAFKPFMPDKRNKKNAGYRLATREVSGEKIPVMYNNSLLMETTPDSGQNLYAYANLKMEELPNLTQAAVEDLPTIDDKFDPVKAVRTVNLGAAAFLCTVCGIGGAVKWCHNKLFGSRDKHDINKSEEKNIQILAKQKQQQAQPAKVESQQSPTQEKQGELHVSQSGVRERSDQQEQSAPSVQPVQLAKPALIGVKSGRRASVCRIMGKYE